jgi:hypothetical protein
MTRFKEAAEKYANTCGSYQGPTWRAWREAFQDGAEYGYQAALEAVLAAIDREQNYHEFLDEKGEMRHPILACKEIRGYVRALKGQPK